MKSKHLIVTFIILSWAFFLLQPEGSTSGEDVSCFRGLSSKNAVLVADGAGEIIYQKNETKLCVPASTLKLLTALTAIHHLGLSYRFRTEFYMDEEQNLKVKGYGDPLLISEVLKEIADVLVSKTHSFHDLMTDDTYFSHQIVIPGQGSSTNPYDAPVGAFCANFNTIFFKSDQAGRIISAEAQTPLIPFAVKRIQALKEKDGRYTFSHSQHDAAQYAGELLLHFLRKKGAEAGGTVRSGKVEPGDRILYTHHSGFTLEDVIQKMLEFSNNFMANQIVIFLGARIYGPPGTLEKGVRLLKEFAVKEMELKGIRVVEGSGISRKNQLSATHMLKVLRRFRPYRNLLRREGQILYKSGTLRGIRTRVGFIERIPTEPSYFVLFLDRSSANMSTLMKCVKHVAVPDVSRRANYFGTARP